MHQQPLPDLEVDPCRRQVVEFLGRGREAHVQTDVKPRRGEQFEIQIAGERLYVPVRATYTVEHEREDGEEEIEFQIKWSLAES